MANTNISAWTDSQRLNMMKVDLISVHLVTDTAAIANNQVVSDFVEIPYATAVKGGTAIIQSIKLADDGEQGANLDLVFSDANTSLGTLNADVSGADAVGESKRHRRLRTA